MPLDQRGKDYAALLFQKQQEKILADQSTELKDIAADFGRRNMMQSGIFLSAKANAIGRHVGLLIEARAQSFVQAYEKSGLSFDEAAVAEIRADLTSFSEGQVRNLRHAAARLAAQIPVPNLTDTLASQMETALRQAVAATLRDLRIKQHETVLSQQPRVRAYAAAMRKQWDVFISHASDDKPDFVRPLANALGNTGLKVWYDEITLTVGDSLRRKIDEGLANSRYGVVVLSPNFFRKQWPQQELDGLVNQEVAGIKVILPVWHNIDFAEVNGYSPILAGRLAAKSSDGIQRVVQDIRTAMGLEPAKPPDAVTNGPLTKAARIQMQLNAKPQPSEDGHVLKTLYVTLVNDTPQDFSNYSLRVCLPASVLDHRTMKSSEEEKSMDPNMRCFRYNQSHYGRVEPRSTKSLTIIEYCITCGGKGLDWAQPHVVSEAPVTATIWVEGHEYSASKTIRELSVSPHEP